MSTSDDRTLYTVRTSFGMGIFALDANSLGEAEEIAERRWGREHVESVAEATDADISYVASMSGHLPREAKARLAEIQKEKAPAAGNSRGNDASQVREGTAS